MDLRRWIAEDLASLRGRLDRGVLSIVPPDARRDHVDGGGIPAVYVLWHTARHHDVAVNGVLRGVDEVVVAHTGAVGVDTDMWRGLAEAEDTELVDVLDPEAVGVYALEVIDTTLGWVSDHDPSSLGELLDTVPDSAAALERLGTPTDRFDWLYGMWDAKPAAFFLSWEAIGHGVNHLGELISLRNRLGLSPF